jgi:hypothetical protein
MTERTKPASETAVAETAERAVPWDGMSRGERMARNADLALGLVHELLSLPFDPTNLKLLAHQKDTALTILSQQIRIEAERLREPQARGQSIRDFYERYQDRGDEGEP